MNADKYRDVAQRESLHERNFSHVEILFCSTA